MKNEEGQTPASEEHTFPYGGYFFGHDDTDNKGYQIPVVHDFWKQIPKEWLGADHVHHAITGRGSFISIHLKKQAIESGDPTAILATFNIYSLLFAITQNKLREGGIESLIDDSGMYHTPATASLAGDDDGNDSADFGSALSREQSDAEPDEQSDEAPPDAGDGQLPPPPPPEGIRNQMTECIKC